MMKRLMIAFVATMSLMLGIAGSAAAVQPDTHACGPTGGTPASLVLADLDCGAGPHGPPA